MEYIEKDLSAEMENHEYERIARRESYYFWHVGRREILKEALSRHVSPDSKGAILDYGCGPGGNILFLSYFGRVSGVDVSDTALAFAKSRGFVELVKVIDHHTPFADASFDVVTSLDVFEHIKDDEAAMAECFRIVKPGGILLAAVPAHRWLWSDHDVALHHVRRYTHRELASKLENAGFQIFGWSHFVTLAVLINGFRIVRDHFLRPKRAVDTYDVEFSPLVNRVLLEILRLEKRIIRWIPIPFGSSLFIVAQKSSRPL